jgi:Protein of unknown function (DUF3396)
MNTKELAQLLDALQVKDQSESVAICFGLSCTLYFSNGHLPEVHRQTLDCFASYLKLCASEIRWARLPNRKGFISPDLTDVHKFTSSLPQPEDDEYWELTVHGGEKRTSANPYYFEVMLSPASRRILSYVKASLPLDWYRRNNGSFSSLMLEFCRALRPISGYGGITLLEAPNNSIRQRHQPEVSMIANRFPGLDLDYPFYHVIHLVKGIKGVNWLTCLNNSLLEKVGGLGHLKQTLSAEIVFHEFPHGVLVQAGTHPQLGDRQQEIALPLYTELSRALKPIRVTEHWAFHFNVPGAFDQAASEAWLARLD